MRDFRKSPSQLHLHRLFQTALNPPHPMAKPRLPIDPPLRTRSKTIKHEPSQASDAGAPQEAGSPQRRGVAQALGEKPLNILNVALGDKLIGPSYPSIYREEIVTGEPVETLYICERCFRYSKEAVLLLAHKVRVSPARGREEGGNV